MQRTAREWRKLLYSRIINIFSYENLPEEINEFAFKLFLFRCGKVIFYKINDKFVVQPFAYTDRLDWYYIPKNGRVVNPWLPQGHQNKEFELANEAILFNSTPDMYNFREWGLVADLIYKTSYQLAENDISYYCIQRNHRLIAVFTAETDIQKAELNRVLERMYNGEADITMGEDLVSHIQVNPITMNSTRSSITELIEFHQFILANFYHSFGINSNYNLKREQLNSNEIDVNQEVLRLNIEDMLRNREKGVEKINDLYGLDIRVSLNQEVYASLLSLTRESEQGTMGEVQNNQQESSESSTEEGNSGLHEQTENETAEKEDGRPTDNTGNSDNNVSEKEVESSDKTEDKTEDTEGEVQQAGEPSVLPDDKISIEININTPNVSEINVEGSDIDESSQSSDVSSKEEVDRMGGRKSDD